MWQIAALRKKNSGGKLEYAKIPPKITKLRSSSFRSKPGKTRAFCIAASCHRRSFISSFPAIRPRTGCGTERESGTLLPPIWNRAGTVGEAGRRARISPRRDSWEPSRRFSPGGIDPGAMWEDFKVGMEHLTRSGSRSSLMLNGSNRRCGFSVS